MGWDNVNDWGGNGLSRGWTQAHTQLLGQDIR